MVDRYRDVILVDSAESVIIKQVKYAIRKCGKILEANSFIGLTHVDDECKIFVSLSGAGAEVTHPFGHYWFQIRSINFISNLGLCFEIGEEIRNIYLSNSNYVVFSCCSSVCEF